MSLSCWTWRSLRRSSTNSCRSAAFRGADEFVVAGADGAPSAPLAARIQLNMLVSWQPNSRASSLGLRPVATKSIICWRNCAGYGALGWGILDSLFHYDKVSVKKGQLQVQTIGILKVTKWQTQDELMTIEELRNAIDVTAKIANELNAILPA
jgi:hypothetical protein